MILSYGHGISLFTTFQFQFELENVLQYIYRIIYVCCKYVTTKQEES